MGLEKAVGIFDLVGQANCISVVGCWRLRSRTSVVEESQQVAVSSEDAARGREHKKRQDKEAGFI